MPAPSDLRLHDSHATKGARFGERRGQPVVASYGEFAGEYAAARERAALVDLSTRSLLEASGPARVKLLQGLQPRRTSAGCSPSPAPGIPRASPTTRSGCPTR